MNHELPKPSRRHLLGWGAAGLAGTVLGAPMGAAADSMPRAEDRSARRRIRPAYHYSSPSGRLADPNGLIRIGDEYHLFHQQDGTWAHAVSTDLVRWKRLPLALTHDRLGQAMSGGAVSDPDNRSGLVPGGGALAFYTCTEGGQAPCLAASTDAARTWTRYSGNPLLPNEGRADFRAPSITWYDRTREWIMVITSGAAIEVYASGDLIHWQWRSRIGPGLGGHDALWECPCLIPLKLDGHQWWVLVVSVGDNEATAGSTVRYVVGDFDGTTFLPNQQAMIDLDLGQDFCAVQPFYDTRSPDGTSMVWLAWMGNWRYPYVLADTNRANYMTVPRTIRLVERDGTLRLAQSPVRQLESLRGSPVALSGSSVTDGVVRLPVSGSSLDVEVEVDLSQAEECWLSFLGWEPGSLERDVRIVLNRDGKVSLDRTRCATATVQVGGKDIDFRIRRDIETRLGDRVRLRVLVDVLGIEVFVDDGLVSGSFLVLNNPKATAVAFGARGTARIASGAAWQMRRLSPFPEGA